MAKKTQLSYKEIEDRLRLLKDDSISADEIGYSLLYAFGKGEREIARMREGKGIIKTFDPGLLIKGEFCYRATTTLRLVAELEELKADTTIRKAAPKIIAVSDGQTIRAFDTRQRESFEQQVDRLYCDFEFFYPLAGVERIEYVEESPADIKAAEKLAKLHDEIRAYNEFTSDSDLHDLNIFIARLLFCFFAEDTGIFEPNIFTDTIKRYTLDDGSDLNQFLDDAFLAMAMERKNRPEDLPTFINQFPFVSGGLFSKIIILPQLSARARKIIIECGDLDWQNINPDIFGSMIQAVVNPDVRANQGMHYTSVPNIMKVIQPLFLDELRTEYETIAGFVKGKKQQLDLGMITSPVYIKECKIYEKQCRKLLLRMSKMKFFDPACGSGNFLIITYKMLRLLEMDILRLMQHCNTQGMLEFVDGSVIKLSQFYGIELLDFPHEIAMLSLWLAEHQMNQKLNRDFGVNTQALPLKDITQIVCGNACRVDWNEVCPHTKEEEVFIFGNPPYLGSSLQEQCQKEDMEVVFGNNTGWKKLDYICCWFYKGAEYCVNNPTICAFVSTNSICQGEQVSLLWNPVFSLNIEIKYAITSFKWSNNAKSNAQVFCIIVGIGNKSKYTQKLLINGSEKRKVDFINPYLNTSTICTIRTANSPISDFPAMISGSKTSDFGYLMFDEKEKEEIITKYPELKPNIKRFIGSAEFLRGSERYCLYIKDDEVEKLRMIDEINDRLQSIAAERERSKKIPTQKMAKQPWKYTEDRFCPDEALFIPLTSSEKYAYIPVGLLPNDTIISNAGFAIYNPSEFIIGIVTSKIHNKWNSALAGKMKTDNRYSAALCYNTFPFPKIPDTKKAEIEEAATDILLTREPYLTMGKTLADLYDPDTMPDDLREAHAKLDDIVESCYPGYPFASDEARLECLFKMYEKMTNH